MYKTHNMCFVNLFDLYSECNSFQTPTNNIRGAAAVSELINAIY